MVVVVVVIEVVAALDDLRIQLAERVGDLNRQSSIEVFLCFMLGLVTEFVPDCGYYHYHYHLLTVSVLVIRCQARPPVVG